MANRARKLAALVVTGTMLAGARDAAAIDEDASGVANADVAPVTMLHVRSQSATIVRIIQQASEQSETFRKLVSIINASNGVVNVEEGLCPHRVLACLVTVTPAGAGYRFLHVRVDTARADCELAGSIGHELYHATEVLRDPHVTTGAAMFWLFRRIGNVRSDAFETDGAINAGIAVRKEFSKSLISSSRAR